ncbi:hypothetical protein D3H64_06090 [Atopobacter sp. AH10]|uniref:hypothetical protein n=1 Tax=Atopobacter sp. AH10 TaxID=2315861 RepID=UPI000EF27B1D|nr:hypothetical protein [Atopobacter sp. AH10]RLK63161.1 hypothetical protein D3H64_06090 [Atopobacter sp. AH10]
MESNNNSNGMGFMSWLALLLIAAKLFGVINWSWWLVLLPVWIWLAFMAIVLVILGVAHLIYK